MYFSEAAPELIREWDYEKNNDINPEIVSSSSHKIVWWKCQKGHYWKASVANRVRKNQGCPYCSGRLPIIGIDDLFSTNPELEKEWNYKKNTDIDPKLLKKSSSKKVWWVCSKGHEWETGVLYRGVRGQGCPFCAGNKVLSGFNDLESKYEDIAAEWDYSKNKLFPNQVSAKNSKKYWWICPECGYSYQAAVYNRTHNNSGCPKCNVRFKTSFPEQVIFYYIKQVFTDAKNGYMPKSFNGMELDIFIPQIMTAIEYDGERWHCTQMSVERDFQKYQLCQKHNIRLIRIKENCDNRNNCDYVIKTSCDYSQESFESVFLKLKPLLGCDIHPDVYRHRDVIISQYRFALKENSLAKKYPEIAKEWDYSKNNNLLPTMFSSGSNENVYWVCQSGHSYKAAIANRVNHSVGCPFCAGKKVLRGFNDLESQCEDVAVEWDYSMNKPLMPYEVTYGSGKRVWWICPKGHPSYKSSIYSRTGKHKTGCPVCSGNKVLSGTNDLATCFPDLIKEWHSSLNSISPDHILPGSNYKAWWICSKGHEWTEKVSLRALRGFGCPYCSGHRVITDKNDLKTVFPQIAAEWNYKLNKGTKPEDYLPNSNKKVWWICSKGHEWESTIAARQKNGCPYCSGRYAIPGENDLKKMFPKIALDWDEKMNNGVSPDTVKPYSHKNALWKCHKCGYEWKQIVANRTKRNSGCPKCS